MTDPFVPLPAEHLSYEEMERWVDDASDSDERELVQTHIEQCAICRGEIEDLERSRDTSRLSQPRRTWRWPAAAAVALVAIVSAALWFTQRDGVRPALIKPEIVASLNPSSAAQRGAAAAAPAFALLQPVGTLVVETQPTLRWQQLSGATSYTVVVAYADTGAGGAAGSTTSAEWLPPRALPRGRTYSWQVTAHRDRDAIIEPRPPRPDALFRIATESETAAWHRAMDGTHLSAGLALAQHGFLDDADRELRLARADGVLAQVRSWRATATRR